MFAMAYSGKQLITSSLASLLDNVSKYTSIQPEPKLQAMVKAARGDRDLFPATRGNMRLLAKALAAEAVPFKHEMLTSLRSPSLDPDVAESFVDFLSSRRNFEKQSSGKYLFKVEASSGSAHSGTQSFLVERTEKGYSLKGTDAGSKELLLIPKDHLLYPVIKQKVKNVSMIKVFV